MVTSNFTPDFPWTPVASNNCNLVLGSATICPIRPIGILAATGERCLDFSVSAADEQQLRQRRSGILQRDRFGFPGDWSQ